VKYKDLLRQWEDAIWNRKINEAKDLAEVISNHSIDKQSPHYLITLASYYLLIKDVKKANDILNTFNVFTNDIDGKLLFMYYHLLGVTQYYKKIYQESIENFLEAERFLVHIRNEPLKIAEFHYKFASSYYEAMQISNSIKQANIALRIYKDNFEFERAADCENLLGIINKEIGQYKEAKKHYINSLKYAEAFNDKVKKAMIYHNLGSLFAKKNDSTEAIRYYRIALDLINELEIKEWKLKTLYLLSKEHLKLGNEEGKVWVKEGLKLSLELENEEYQHHFKMLLTRYDGNIEDIDRVFEEGICYFISKKMWRYVKEYGILHGTFMKSKYIHEKASHYFYLAFQADQQINR
jgi:tetratricopeptide (TPR) repeat protein